MGSFEDRIATIVNDQKGQLMALSSLALSLLRAMPLDMRSQARQEWQLETESAKTALLNSQAPDEVSDAFDRYVKMVNDLWIFPGSP